MQCNKKKSTMQEDRNCEDRNFSVILFFKLKLLENFEAKSWSEHIINV